MKYDYFVAGRWRNHKMIRPIIKKLRDSGKAVYCFIENEYDGDGIKFESYTNVDADTMMQAVENIQGWQTNPTFKQIFDNDIDALKNSANFMLIFPAGLSAHMELGVAYGMGKVCYGIGQPEKSETLYMMFDKLFPTIDVFLEDKL